MAIMDVMGKSKVVMVACTQKRPGWRTACKPPVNVKLVLTSVSSKKPFSYKRLP